MVLDDETISAEVILKSKTGRSLTEGTASITSNNIREFQPSLETTNEAKQGLSQLGFQVTPSDITMTVVGPKSLFEKVFDTQLQVNNTTKEVSIISPNKDLPIPDSLQRSVEKVVFIPPPEYHQ
jgi:hypothetical protein